MTTEYDFIIVGAGPSGSTLASRLASSPARPSILLLEAGGRNDLPTHLVPSDRYTLFATEPSLNWGYKTVPQNHLAGQEIDYSRGKGLGGSTAINFSCWVIGADADFDEWAKRVGDDAWSWSAVKERLKRIEAYHVEVPEEFRGWIAPKEEDHGTNGMLHLSYAPKWEKGMEAVFRAAEETGMGVNPDVNSGNPIGMGIGAACMYKGSRTTASSYLADAPSNLTIVTEAAVAKVLFKDGKHAYGVQCIDGREFTAKNEVVLAGGALNSPQLLMLSGVGPKDELKKHGIEVVQELEEVGKNMQDHCFSTATLLQKEGTNDRMTFASDSAAMAAAKVQYEKDKTGVMAEMYCGTPMGWFKNEAVVQSSEFKELDAELQEYIQKPTVPIYEIATHVPPLYTGDYTLQPTDAYLTALAFVMNPQSTGTVTLASSNPSAPPVVDPNLLSHPFDRRVMIEAMRSLMTYLSAPSFAATTVRMIGCPVSDSDEDIWDHCKKDLLSSWHMCSTVRMGKEGDDGACVGTDFRVKGVEALRVVDLSVLPLLPNNHTQSTAYLVGETAAEKMIAEYGLDREAQGSAKGEEELRRWDSGVEMGDRQKM